MPVQRLLIYLLQWQQHLLDLLQLQLNAASCSSSLATPDSSAWFFSWVSFRYSELVAPPLLSANICILNCLSPPATLLPVACSLQPGHCATLPPCHTALRPASNCKSSSSDLWIVGLPDCWISVSAFCQLALAT